MAVGVVAACQIMGFSDVHLALTEDHSWAVFGENGSQSSEITWHGKGTEDRRGMSVTESVAEKNWLYLNPIVCMSRHLEVVAMVISINPSITTATDSVQMSTIQQELLWLLYDRGLLNKYPMALGTLADMEEMNPTPARPGSLALYSLAVDNAVKHCEDLYVYPYTYIGNYFYRHCQYKNALKYWASAAQVISRYNYNREDEVIYKEFLEIANDIIPNVVRLSSVVSHAPSPASQFPPLLSDPESFANLLRFYDGICKWEEGSSMPVLHIVWANHMGTSLAKFELKAREKVDIVKSVAAETTNDSKRMSVDASTAKIRSVADHLESPESPMESPESPADCGSNLGGGGQALKLIPYDEEGATSKNGSSKFGTPVGPPSRVTRLGDAANADRLKLVLRSEKMMAMRELLVAEKLNLSAIKLQLTAQSQVYMKYSRAGPVTGAPPVSTGGSAGTGGSASGATPARKRQRRE